MRKIAFVLDATHQDFSQSRGALFFVLQDTLRKRLGSPAIYENDKRIWARTKVGEFEVSDINTFGPYHQLQVGVDKSIGEDCDVHQFIGVGLSQLKMKLKAYDYASQNKLQANLLTLYYTRIKPESYWDVLGKLGHVSGTMHLNSEFLDNAHWRSTLISLGVEAGRTFRNTKGYFVEPQGQLTYSYLSHAKYRSENDIVARLHSIQSLLGRVGLEVGRTYEKGKLFGNVFLHHEFLARTHGDFYDGHFNLSEDHRLHSKWITLGMGAQYELTKRIKLHAHVERAFGSDVSNPWELNLGIRYSF